MTLKVRAKNTMLADSASDDPTVFVNVEVFEDSNDQVIASNVISYSLAGMDGMTANQKRTRVQNDAVEWAKTVRDNAIKAAPILTLMGMSGDIPTS